MESTSESSVDTPATEKEAPREKRQRKAKGSIDWAPVKRDWNRGLAVAEIARMHGIETSTIYAQACRHKWTKRPVVLKSKIQRVDPNEVAKKAVEKQIQKEIDEKAPVIANAVKQRLNEWFEKVLRTSGKLQMHIENTVEGHCEVEEIKSLSSSLETVDRIARRTFGLDSPTGTSAVSVFSVSSPAILCPIIDVDSLPEANPPTPVS